MKNFKSYSDFLDDTPDYSEVRCCKCRTMIKVARYPANEQRLRDEITALSKLAAKQDEYINSIHAHFGRQFIKESFKCGKVFAEINTVSECIKKIENGK